MRHDKDARLTLWNSFDLAAQGNKRHGPGNVVPLIAADRLTDDELVEAICDEVDPTWHLGDPDDSRREPYRAHVRTLLAALRAHLEKP